MSRRINSTIQRPSPDPFSSVLVSDSKFPDDFKVDVGDVFESSDSLDKIIVNLALRTSLSSPRINTKNKRIRRYYCTGVECQFFLSAMRKRIENEVLPAWEVNEYKKHTCVQKPVSRARVKNSILQNKQIVSLVCNHVREYPKTKPQDLRILLNKHFATLRDRVNHLQEVPFFSPVQLTRALKKTYEVVFGPQINW